MKTIALAFGIGVLGLATPALTNDAKCFATDDQNYDCTLETLDDKGSFEISAPNKPTFKVVLDSADFATVAVTLAGGEPTPLRGAYQHSQTDAGCWISLETGAQICAW